MTILKMISVRKFHRTESRQESQIKFLALMKEIDRMQENKKQEKKNKPITTIHEFLKTHKPNFPKSEMVSLDKGRITRKKNQQVVYTILKNGSGYKLSVLQFTPPKNETEKKEVLTVIELGGKKTIRSENPLYIFTKKIAQKGKDFVYEDPMGGKQLKMGETLKLNGKKAVGQSAKILKSTDKIVIKKWNVSKKDVFDGNDFHHLKAEKVENLDFVSHWLDIEVFMSETDMFFLNQDENFVKIYDRGIGVNKDGTVCLIYTMEKMKGNIEHYPFPDRLKDDVLEHLTIQLLNALAFLKRKKIVHLDIKPKNIVFLDKIFKYCDFGTMKTIEQMRKMQNIQDQTFEYFAPEYCVAFMEGDYKKLDHKVDLWAFGISMVEFILKQSSASYFYTKHKKTHKSAVYKKNFKLIRETYLDAIWEKVQKKGLNIKFFNIIEKTIRLEPKNKALKLVKRSINSLGKDILKKRNSLVKQIEKMLIIDFDYKSSLEEKKKLVLVKLKGITDALSFIYKNKDGAFDKIKTNLSEPEIIKNILNYRPEPDLLLKKYFDIDVSQQ
ncbi:protein kinase [Candidatus Margulisiibacteriota bacterium]